MARVLVIGTDELIARGLQTHRPLAGCEIQAYPGSVEALRAVRLRSYDVVVTDPTTTVREDIALVEEMRHIRPGLRGILLAPAATSADVIEALRHRVFACFTPPFAIGEIAAMVVNALEQDNWREAIEVTSGLPYWMTLRVACNQINGERLVNFMTEYSNDIPEADRSDLITAFREMLMNAMEHGAGFDGEKVIEVTAARTARAIVYHFRDPGAGFDREDLPHAAISNPPDEPLAHLEYRSKHGLRPGGFGILIAKQLVDEVVFNEPGNEVLLIKHTD
jgi:anti-sigma regulatory factor (Ser/Thr protein kinase)